MNKTFCDRCGQVVEGDVSIRTYKIVHNNEKDLCNNCYTDIVKFIENKDGQD